MHPARLFVVAPLLAILLMSVASAAEPAATECYELRIYYAAEGKLDALHARFRDHTCKLFEKHGMTNVGYWTPTENPERKLVYMLAFPSREARDASFKAFGEDPAWQAAYKESEKDGKLVNKVESYFLHATDYSPVIEAKQAEPQRVFELRTYITTPGNLDALHARFRDHTCKLFEKHGMTNVGYWIPQENPEQKLYYVLSYADRKARDKSWAAFMADPVRQFVPVQQRLADKDLLNLWTTPIGSAVFAILPGARDGELLGERLFA